MADEKTLNQAKNVYQTLCQALDHRNWKYRKEEDDLVVVFDVSGDDFPMSFVIAVDAERQLIRLQSKLPVTMSEDNRLLGAAAACIAGYYLVDGNFDYDISSGTIHFRMTACFRESIIGEELFAYLIDCACGTIDNYNDKFFMLNKGLIDLKKFGED